MNKNRVVGDRYGLERTYMGKGNTVPVGGRIKFGKLIDGKLTDDLSGPTK